MSFHEVRLPDDVERGAQGGPSFSTGIVTLSSGFEQRNGNWSRARLSWDVGYGIQNREGYMSVVEFFYARRGRLYGFRFKDWADFELSTEAIAAGDGSTTKFQVYKTYSDLGGSYQRPIQKIVSGTVLVYIDAVLQTENSDYTLDYDTGVITFASAPGDTLSIAITCEFDVPVRFGVDQIETSLEYYDAGSIPNIPVQEILQPLASLA